VPRAEAAHAGIDFEVHVHVAAGGGGGSVQPLDFVDGRHGGGDVVFRREAHLFGEEGAEDEDGPVGADFAERGGLGEIGNGKEIGA
jgi:hypothetical protein